MSFQIKQKIQNCYLRGVSKRFMPWRYIVLTTIDIEMILGDLQL